MGICRKVLELVFIVRGEGMKRRRIGSGQLQLSAYKRLGKGFAFIGKGDKTIASMPDNFTGVN